MTTKKTSNGARKSVATKRTPTTKVSRPRLPSWLVAYLWARASGRCQFLGCNVAVWKDVLTTHDINHGKIAHIIAFSPDGPRGDPTESPRLKLDPSNLMLLCGKHHDLVDNSKHVATYTIQLLRHYKKEHEDRIERLTDITENLKTVPLVVDVPVGSHVDPIPLDQVFAAISAVGRYPDDQRRINVDLLGMTGRDRDVAFWSEARGRIASDLARQLGSLTHRGSVDHLSVFAFGPIPLLIDLGRQLGGKIEANTFNLHRTPKGWQWPSDARRISAFRVVAPVTNPGAKAVALVVSVSSAVQLAHLHAVLPDETPVFELKVDAPMLDGVRFPSEVEEFASATRDVMEKIHQSRAQSIHVFAAVPVALAVEFGRSLLPKLHAPLVLYDYHAASGGWRCAFEINEVRQNGGVG